ncbi:MAG: response regulator [Alphaproteobacteria bacterium]
MTALVSTIMRSAGVRDIRTAVNGALAFSLLKDRPVDVALVDQLMDVMDGVTFTRTVRTDPESPDAFLPIVLVSGCCESGMVRRAIDAGINDVVIKPVAPKTLLTHIARTLLVPRPYVKTTSFFGPNRRRPAATPYNGSNRRND